MTSANERARIQAAVKQAILQEPMLTLAAAGAALGGREMDRLNVRRYRERSWLVGLPTDDGYLYPAFQFDAEQHTVFPEVKAVNERIEASLALIHRRRAHERLRLGAPL